MNLVFDACDAMPQGGSLEIKTTNLRLTASLSQRHVDLPAGNYVLITVSRAGAGVDDATPETFSERFYTTKPGGVGTGLGLSTVYGIVERSRGWASISSE